MLSEKIIKDKDEAYRVLGNLRTQYKGVEISRVNRGNKKLPWGWYVVRWDDKKIRFFEDKQ